MKNPINRFLSWVWLQVCFIFHTPKQEPGVPDVVQHDDGTPANIYPYQSILPDEESTRRADKKPQASMSAKKRARLKKQKRNRKKRNK